MPQGNITINATLIKDLPFNWDRDFTPVTLIAYAPNMLVVNPKIPARNITELIAYAKANPGKLTYISNGSGTSPHMAGELLKSVAGINITHVPYKNISQGFTDLVGGQVEMMLSLAHTILPQARGGKLRMIGITGRNRSPLVPEAACRNTTGAPLPPVSVYQSRAPGRSRWGMGGPPW